jgi:hypothetical protein
MFEFFVFIFFLKLMVRRVTINGEKKNVKNKKLELKL